MKRLRRFIPTVAIAAAFFSRQLSAAEENAGFEGKIESVITQGNETTPLLYTAGANFLRIEVTGSNSPNPIDVADLKFGTMTLVFPHNRSFVRLRPGRIPMHREPVAPGGPPDAMTNSLGKQQSPSIATPTSIPFGGPPAPPTPLGGLPPGIGPQSQGTPAPNIPPMPAMPGNGMPPMPMIPMPQMEKMELKPTGKKDKILGFACEQYEIKQHGETMEVWATDKLLPFQPYLRNQPSRFGPRMIEEQWGELLTAKKLFPLRASLHFDNGAERFHFEVKSITPEKITDKDGRLFQPPAGYFEIQPLPF